MTRGELSLRRWFWLHFGLGSRCRTAKGNSNLPYESGLTIEHNLYTIEHKLCSTEAMLEYFITSKTKRSLLKLFLTNPERRFYTREIAKITGEPLNGVRRELGYLEKAGLLRSRQEGNLKYFEVIKEFPFYPELKKIIYSTVALGDYLRDSLKDSESIELAFVYGSVARNEEKEKSDIDLFVVGEIEEGELHGLVSDIEKGIGREINYTLMTRKEFGERRNRGEPFLRRVMGEKKFVLKGNLDVH
jgi:predicted nucleotidyltransferase